jgi:hypothetical protein
MRHKKLEDEKLPEACIERFIREESGNETSFFTLNNRSSSTRNICSGNVILLKYITYGENRFMMSKHGLVLIRRRRYSLIEQIFPYKIFTS